MATLRGGDKFEKALAEIGRQLGRGGGVKVGFLRDATYPDGTSVAMVAAIQNFGAPGANIPPRPFFSNMIADKQGEWPKAIRDLLRENDNDVPKALELAGAAIAGQLRTSIIATNDPPLSESTIRRKGSAKPLVDTGHMLNSVDHEVKAG